MSDVDDMIDNDYDSDELVCIQFYHFKKLYGFQWFSVCFIFILIQLYSSESASEPDVDLENQYYNSKALKEENPKSALDSFKKVLELEQEKGEWGFRALKQMIKINFKLVRQISSVRFFIQNLLSLYISALLQDKLWGNDETL